MNCWYCKWPTMIMEEAPDLGPGWYRCPKCKATWIKVPKSRLPRKVRAKK